MAASPGNISRRTFLTMSAASVTAATAKERKHHVSAAALDESGAGCPSFLKAKPVWPKGMEREMNMMAGFRLELEAPGPADAVLLRITGATVYRVTVNGVFAGYGPVRACHEHYRVDEIDLRPSLAPGANILGIEVAGYNCRSFAFLDQPSFLQAEVIAGGIVVAATGAEPGGFQAYILSERVQKAVRFSYQRTFTEIYRLSPGFDRWRTDRQVESSAVDYEVFAGKELLPRRVPYCTFPLRRLNQIVSRGYLQPYENPSPKKDRSQIYAGIEFEHNTPAIDGFRESDLETVPHMELQNYLSFTEAGPRQSLAENDVLDLSARRYAILDFGSDNTGFLGLTVTCQEKTRLVLTFDDLLVDGDIKFPRADWVNLITFELEPGTYRLESFEPYTCRYIKPQTLEGSCRISNVFLREFKNPHMGCATFECSDPRLNEIFEAGRATLEQNCNDALMEDTCRERATWIIVDSLYVARGSFALLHETSMEKNLFEDYLLPKSFDHVPDGTFPVVYPADQVEQFWLPHQNLYIPIQLEEYYRRGGDRDMVKGFESKLSNYFRWLAQFENEDGLLEKLPGWLWIEWSQAQAFGYDVNYPVNMLYARSLATMARLYERPRFAKLSEKIKRAILEQSYDGQFFIDNAVRENGVLRRTGNRTEVCQYYAFDCDIVTPESHPGLWATLRDDFGPKRRLSEHVAARWPEIHLANSLPGYTIRLDLLSRFGESQAMFDDAICSLHHMACLTNTLWEHMDPSNGLCHGFQGQICDLLYRDALGLHRVDTVNKAITLRFTNHNLTSCRGSVPVGDDVIDVEWSKRNDVIRYRISAPPEYRIEVENLGRSQIEAT